MAFKLNGDKTARSTSTVEEDLVIHHNSMAYSRDEPKKRNVDLWNVCQHKRLVTLRPGNVNVDITSHFFNCPLKQLQESPEHLSKDGQQHAEILFLQDTRRLSKNLDCFFKQS